MARLYGRAIYYILEYSQMDRELRTNRAEFRVSKGKIAGYAAVFNQDSEDLGGFTERIAPGAFKEALKKSDARALINHDQNLILARESAGTLRLREDSKGLFMTISPPNTSYARDLMESIKRGDIREQSFAFRVSKDDWQNLDDPEQAKIRTIREISHLYDVGPVTYPAYPQTSAALRSMERARRQFLDGELLDDLFDFDLSEFDRVIFD
jgi:HK97 family phage prohead protease